MRGVDRFHDIKPIIWGRLDAWEAGLYVALVKAVKEANLDVGGGSGGTRVQRADTTSLVRKYHYMVLGGKVHAAVRMVMDRVGGGAYHPYDLD